MKIILTNEYKSGNFKEGGKAAVTILKARSRVLNIHITFMHVFVCVCVCVCLCVRAFMCTLGCQLVVTTTLYYGCEKVIHKVAQHVPNVPWSLHFYVVTMLCMYV